MRRKDKFRN